MKAVLMSIKPQWCELIASGKKTIEVRKTKPKLETPFKVYIYCTKGNKHLALMQNRFGTNLIACCDWKTAFPFGGNISNGKVIGEFVCDRIDNIEIRHFTVFGHENRYCAIGDNADKQWLNHSCLNYDEVIKYGKGATLYGWHISDLKIYDKPKELNDFYKPCLYGEDTNCHSCDKSGYNPDMHIDCFNKLTRPPQSWCYVEEV